MDFGRALLIDSTGQPVDVVNWEKAMVLVLLNKAVVIDAYDNVVIRSARQAYKLPSVVQLMGRSQRRRDVFFSKKAVFYRDKNQCAYCLTKLKKEELTIDHIIPACQGGEKTFENIVTACQSCNLKKGGRTPEQAKMELKLKPYTPKWSHYMFLQLKKDDPIEKWKDWFPALHQFETT